MNPLPYSHDAASMCDVPRTLFIMPGSRKLGKQAATAIGNGYAVIINSHSLIVGGKDLRQAAEFTLIIEETARKILITRAMKKEPRNLSREALAERAKRKELAG